MKTLIDTGLLVLRQTPQGGNWECDFQHFHEILLESGDANGSPLPFQPLLHNNTDSIARVSPGVHFELRIASSHS